LVTSFQATGSSLPAAGACLVIRAKGVTDTGRVRKVNEDRFVSDLALRLFAVADGMGGHQAGEVASELAIEAITSFIKLSVSDEDLTWPYGIDPTLSFDGNRLRTAICLANRRVFRAAETSDDYAGMGTTLVGVLVDAAQLAIGSVGDSRIYLLTRGTLEQLTVDDSWAATILAQDPTLKPEEIAMHPMRNVLTNVLGARETVNVHVTERTLASGDTLLLCSDGLHGVLPPATLQDILGRKNDFEGIPQTLVDLALTQGTRDNLTALVVRYEGDQ
jgi:PPM family protein phosphatase